MQTSPTAASGTGATPATQTGIDVAIDRFERTVEGVLGPKAWGKLQNNEPLTSAQEMALLSAAGTMLLDLPIETYAPLVPEAWWKAVGIDPKATPNQRLAEFGAQGKALAERIMRPGGDAPTQTNAHGPPTVAPIFAPLVARSSSVGILLQYLTRARDHLSVDVDVTRDLLGDTGLIAEGGLALGDHVRLGLGLIQPLALVPPRPVASLTLRSSLGVTRFSAELLSERPDERYAFGFAASLAETRTMLQATLVLDDAGHATRYDARLSRVMGPLTFSAGVSEHDHAAWLAADAQLMLHDNGGTRFSLSATLYQPIVRMDGTQTPGVAEGFLWLRIRR